MFKKIREALLKSKGQLFINNEFVDPSAGEFFDVINPATEEVITQVAQGSELDINRAVRVARNAFDKGKWKNFSARERGQVLFQIADFLKKNKQEFAKLETIDNGKPISETLNVDLPLAIECFEYYGGLADKIQGETIPVNGKFFNYTLREPVGVVAQIIPWNFPLLMLAWKLGPALATGCTVVLKPAEQTPLTALKFAELLLQTNLPAGVINIVTGDGRTGEFLAKHKDIDKVAFTGSTEVGKLVGKMAGENLKRVSLELGGKAPNIVFSNADIDEAVKGAVAGIFFNQGEVCCAGSRLFVEESIKEEFVRKLKAHAESLVQGDPLDPKTQIGAQVSEEQYFRITDYILKGVEQGAKIVTGFGGDKNINPKLDRRGWFIPPTILEATDDNVCAKEEIFGPVVTILSFKDISDLKEIINRANNTNYGLSAGIWTRDIGLAHRVAREIRAGTIWVNCYNKFDAASPFGGFKQSGHGRELGIHAIDLYVETKSVWVPLD